MPQKTVSVTVNLDNAAFEPDPRVELARIFRDLAQKIEGRDIPPHTLFDINGNRVGAAYLHDSYPD